VAGVCGAVFDNARDEKKKKKKTRAPRRRRDKTLAIPVVSSDDKKTRTVDFQEQPYLRFAMKEKRKKKA